MSILSALRTYIATYSELKPGALLWVDSLSNNPTSYGIDPLPGARIVEEYIDGSRLMEFPFAFQSTEATASDLERLNTQGFYEALADWFDEQTNAEIFPALTPSSGSKAKTVEKIEATGWGSLFEQGPSGTGIHQIQCKLTYTQARP